MGRRTEGLCVDVPRYFRCPISLEVMKSPVSLCTGITYDRPSIQRWLADGNNTCPATMQILHTTELVPNHTLRRLIQLWYRNNHLSSTAAAVSSGTDEDHGRCLLDRCCRRPQDLLREIRSSADPLPSLRDLAAIARDADRVHELRDSHGCALALGSFLGGDENREMDALEEAVGVLALVLAGMSGDSSAAVIKALADPRIISSVVAVLRHGNICVDSRTNAVRVLQFIAALDTESKLLIAETDGVLSDLARLITDETDPTAIDAGLSCLTAISDAQRLRPKVVRVGIIPAIGKLLYRPSIRMSTAEKALKLLEASSTCAEGRAAICEDAECVVTAVVRRMMKVPPAAAEDAVAVLWRVCHAFGDRRAREAVAKSNGLTKLLLLMQSNCSAAARGMAADLLRIFKVNSKSCLGSYDTKTTHITPF